MLRNPKRCRTLPLRSLRVAVVGVALAGAATSLQSQTLHITGTQAPGAYRTIGLEPLDWITGQSFTDIDACNLQARFASSPPTVVPEPASLLLVATGLLGFVGVGAMDRGRSRD